MMKTIIKILSVLIFVVMVYSSKAQPPPPPGQVLNTGSNAIGGSAPVGEGFLILIGLGAVYSGKKYYFDNKKKEEL